MPILEIFAFAAEAAPEAAALTEAAGAAEVAGAAEAFGAAEAGLSAVEAAELASMGYTAAEIAAMTGVPQGITAAEMATSAVTGGPGAGATGINAAQVSAQQGAAVAPGAGAPITPPGPAPVNQGLLNQIQGTTADILQPRGMVTEPIQMASNAPVTDVPQGIKGVPDTSQYRFAPDDWYKYQQQVSSPEGLKLSAPGEGLTAPSSFTPAQLGQEAPNAIEQGFNKAMDWAKRNPFTAATLAYSGANLLGLNRPGRVPGPQPYSGSLSGYKLSPNFQPRIVNPQDYRRFASGGSTSSRDSLTYSPSFLDYYRSQIDRSAPLAATANIPAVGIYRDEDEDTRSQDAWTAAETRLGKIAKRANVDLPDRYKSNVRLGAINLGPVRQAASGGIMSLAVGGGLNNPTGPVERMSQNVVGAGGMYPQSQMEKTYFATPTQMPASAEVIGADYDARTNPYTGTMMAAGGITSAAGGKLLRGPGDGMSDSIPATIADRQPARLADGEFVIPADVVSHLGNGSTEAGAKQLHGMMDRIRKARTGTKKQGRQINPNKFVPK